MKSKFSINTFNEKHLDKINYFLNGILFLEKECFPTSWQYGDIEAKKYYGKKLRNYKSNINIFLLAEGEIIGYLLLTKLNKTNFLELKKIDKNLEQKGKTMYIDTMQISPNYQGQGLFTGMVLEVLKQVRKKNILFLSIHVRVKNNVAEKTKSLFNKNGCVIVEDRHISKWKPGGGEQYEYLLIKV